MHTQLDPRVRRRVSCELTFTGQRQSGIALNLSRGGLFVQSTARVRPGTIVTVDLNSPARSEAIPVEATVVWKRIVPSRFLGMTHGVVGLSIRHASEAYYALLQQIMPPQPRAPAGPPRAGAGAGSPIRAPEPEETARCRAFRVRIGQSGGPRSRTILVTCDSEQEAQRHALEDMGEGWSIIKIERV